MSGAFVELDRVSKSFGRAQVLREVSLEVQPGQVHALIGPNGAGKSSLGKVIGGFYRPDEGVLRIAGHRVHAWTPHAALSAGIAMIHQELQLVPDLTAAQNVFLGIEAQFCGLLRGAEHERFEALERRCGFGIDPAARVSALRMADRQKVEIMRAIARDARVIVMDEPTSSLSEVEAARLLSIIGALRLQGRSVVYVSHFLEHVLSACDHVTILRDGRVVRSVPMAGETRRSLVEGMLGADAEVSFPARPGRPSPAASPVLECIGLTSPAGLRGATAMVRPGEVVGLIGLVGSGRTELARAVFGADRASGTVRVGGQSYDRRSPAQSVRRGIAFVPEDRRAQGLDLAQTVRPNMSLARLDLISRCGVVQRREEIRRTREMIARFAIVPPDVNGDIAVYSGGNQQKVLLAKWIIGKPRLVILDEPSRGVDLGARRRIHDFIVETAAEGAGILLISSDLEEVLALSHRGYLMHDGRTIGEVDCAGLAVDDVLRQLFEAQSA
jgi:ABC-type sugar transport system ATPase subunit